MTFKEYNKTVSTIKRIAKKWRKPLGLDRYRKFHLQFDEQFADDNGDTAARCFCMWQYNEVTIVFYVPQCSEMDENDLEYVFLHEVMHAKVNEMRWIEDDDPESISHEERVCTELAMMIQSIRDMAAKGKL